MKFKTLIITITCTFSLNAYAWDVSEGEEDFGQACYLNNQNKTGQEIMILTGKGELESDKFKPVIIIDAYRDYYDDNFPVTIRVDDNYESTFSAAAPGYFDGLSFEIAEQDLTAMRKGAKLVINISNDQDITFDLKGSAGAIDKFFVCSRSKNTSNNVTTEKNDTPLLKDTKLYQEIAKQCNDVNLETWSHPTKAVLSKQEVTLERLQLCNNNKYPIFFVRMPVDPIYHSQDEKTKSYFGDLWRGMMKANGYWPFALVELEGQRIIYIQPEYIEEEREYYTSTNYEDFRAE